MKKIYIIGLFGSLLFFLVNCAPSIGKIVTSQPYPTKEEASKNFTAEQLNQGKTIWKNNCDRCHKLRPADKHDPAGWNKTLKSMITKARLTEEEGILVRAYLIANSK